MFMFEKAIAGGRSYWIWILALLAAIGAGFFSYGHQLNYGLGITGLSRDVTWGLYIAQFTFLSGIAASTVIVVLPFYLSDYKAFAKVAILGEFMAMSAIVMGLLFVIADMGQPARMLNVIFHAAPGSMMFWDMIALLGYLVLNAVLALAALRAEQRAELPPAWIKPVMLISIPWAIAMRTVSTLLYSGLPGRSFWLTAILAPRALASAFAAGPALLILLCIILRKLTGFDAGRESILKLARVAAWAISINLFFILMEIFTVFYSGIPDLVEHFEYLFIGLEGHASMVPWMWTSIVFSVVAAVLLLRSRSQKDERILAGAAAAAFLSIWIEQGVGLVVGGFIPSPFGAVTEYSPTIAETAIALGIWAVGSLMVTVFYRITLAVRGELAR